MLSNIVYSDFEDAFLYDGNKQLKIKYNPKIASFKADILETKIDTNIFEQELSKKQDILTSGNGIDIVDNTISGTTIIFRDWSI